MLKLLAHAAEFHDDGTTDVEHYISEPVYALPIFLLSLILAYWLLNKVIKMSLPNTLLVLIGLQFLVGMLSYRWTPAVSIAAIAIGMAMCLFFVLSSLKK